MDKKNKKRTTKKQFETYVKYLESSDFLKTGKLKPSDDPKSLENIWEKMTRELNACGDGPIKTVQEWKKVFREWRSCVRKKVRENKELNAIEEKLLQLTGPVAVTGFELPELGPTAVTDKGVEIGENENEEILIFEVEDNVENGPTSSKRANRKKNEKYLLLDAYQEGEENERKGLTERAKALDNIAEGIHRFCDLYEKKHNLDE